MLWSALFDDRARLVAELAKVGTTPGFLWRDFRDLDEQEFGGRRQLWNRDQMLEQALIVFGDQGHAQPTERTAWPDCGRTPDWGRLPPLEDEATTADRVQRRDPLPTRATAEAVRLRVALRESWPSIEEAVRLSHRKVNYIRLALKHGDLDWDLDRDCLTLGAETQNTAAGLVLPVR